jgi:hypothetical protein
LRNVTTSVKITFKTWKLATPWQPCDNIIDNFKLFKLDSSTMQTNINVISKLREKNIMTQQNEIIILWCGEMSNVTVYVNAWAFD